MNLEDRLLQNLTRSEVRSACESGAIILVPVGAVEQHGDHLPVDTDARLAFSVTQKAAQRTQKANVLVAPLIPYGFSPHHINHHGTASLRLATYLSIIEDITRSFLETGFERVVFVNGHGGNSSPLKAKIAELVTDGLAVAGVDYWVPSESSWSTILSGSLKRFGHACEFETSLVLAELEGHSTLKLKIEKQSRTLPARLIQPWVLPGEVDDAISDARAMWPLLFHSDDCGYYGDPASADVRTGIEIMNLLADRLALFLDDFSSMPIRAGRDIIVPPVNSNDRL